MRGSALSRYFCISLISLTTIQDPKDEVTICQLYLQKEELEAKTAEPKPRSNILMPATAFAVVHFNAKISSLSVHFQAISISTTTTFSPTKKPGPLLCVLLGLFVSYSLVTYHHSFRSAQAKNDMMSFSHLDKRNCRLSTRGGDCGQA